MELKRKRAAPYTIEEMMTILNKDFIDDTTGGYKNKARAYVISSTKFKYIDKKFVICDDQEDSQNENPPLTPYYGSTIMECVSKAFIAFSNG